MKILIEFNYMTNYLLHYIENSLVFKLGISAKLTDVYQDYLIFSKIRQFPFFDYSLFRGNLVNLLNKMGLNCDLIKKNKTFYITNIQLGQEPEEEELLKVAKNIKIYD